MDPKYKIVANNQTQRINPGDDIIIEVYVSGYGTVDESKLHVQHSHPNIVAENPQEITYSIVGSQNSPVTGSDHAWTVPEEDLSPTGFTVELPASFFVADQDSSLGLDRVLSEKSHDNKAPIEIILHTQSSCRRTDYNIDMTMTYRHRTQLQQDQKTVRVHVNTFREQYQRWLIIPGLITAIAALDKLKILELSTVWNVLTNGDFFVPIIVSTILMTMLYLQAKYDPKSPRI